MGMSSQHVAVLAFPFATHPSLLLGLVRRLAAAAPSVHFSFFNTPSSNRSLFSNPNNNCANIIPYDVSDGVPKDYVFSGKPQEDINLFLTVAAAEFETGLQKAEAETGVKFTCLVADAFLWFSADLAQHMAVPWVPLWTSGACSLSLHLYTDLIRKTIGLGVEGRMDEILTFIPGFYELRLGDIPGGILFGNLESPFSVMLHKMGQVLPRAAALPMNSFEELDPDLMKDLKSKFKKILNVGPFNLTSPPPPSSNSDQYGCIPWLDNQNSKSVAYIAFGTVATPPPKEVVALAEALEESGTPFLWSLKDNMKNHLPEGFLERTSKSGKIVEWAPQVQVLSHDAVGVFITHGGWNSVLESIAAGVPIICRPFFGDHPINTWMVENVWKIGVRIEGGYFTKNSTLNALEQVFSQDMGKKLKDQITMLKELALNSVGPNGSSTLNFESLLKLITN